MEGAPRRALASGKRQLFLSCLMCTESRAQGILRRRLGILRRSGSAEGHALSDVVNYVMEQSRRMGPSCNPACSPSK